MTAVNLLALTMLIVIAGRWSQDKKIETSTVVGGLIAAVILTAIESANAKLAQAFAVILLLAAIYSYIPKLAYANAVRKGGKA